MSQSKKINCTVCGLPCDEHRNDERHAPQPSWVEVKKRIHQLESVLKGTCPKCGEDMNASCYGQSTDCTYCEWSLELLGD